MSETISILDGNQFVVSDQRGDMEVSPGETHGLFLSDTRFLSHWVLTINATRPTVLSIDEQEYFSTQIFSAVTSGTVYVNSKIEVARRRSISNGFTEELVIVNHDKDAIDLVVEMEAGADFADLFEVKDDIGKRGTLSRRLEDGTLVLAYTRDRLALETRITSSAPADVSETGFRFSIRLAGHATWSTRFVIAAHYPRARIAGEASTMIGRPDLLDDERRMIAAAPRLVCSWEPLAIAYRRALVDLAALRFRARPFVEGALPAAGLPWFMAIFGRDSLLTSFQALPFLPELAAATLETLALLQGQVRDDFRDEEPGKILHELRLGEMTAFEERPHSPYYGAADSTALFLILLDEYVQWSGDRKLAMRLEPRARAAVDWLDRWGDRDGDGYIEYERRNKETGLENQCWKDSWDSIAYRDGTLASFPRATCELQGYTYDAKLRTARLAREVWGDPVWAAKLEREAVDLKQRFNRDFWIADRGFFALALDGGKRKVDSLSSNIGHLLWSGIVDDDKIEQIVQHLMGDELFSGWGIRTMGTAEGSYNPLGYHVGTVWPHDTSIVAWGLRRCGYRTEAAVLARAMFEAAALFHHRLPEAFGGQPRHETHFPIEYPTACSPQAWASGAPLLFIRVLLGLESDGRHLIVDPAIPDPIDRIELLDIPGVWGKMDAFGRARITIADWESPTEAAAAAHH
jgi:glycogen debranching enzyme